MSGGESIDSNLKTGDDGGSSESYSSGDPVNSSPSVTSPSLVHTAASGSRAPPPTDEELDGWRAFIRYIRDGTQADLLQDALNTVNDQHAVNLEYLRQTHEQVDYVKDQLIRACDASEAALRLDEAQLRESVQRLIQRVKLDVDWRAHLEQATVICQSTKAAVEKNENLRASHLKEKAIAETILKKTESLGVFSHANAKYLTTHLGKILRDPAFRNIKKIAFIPSGSGQDEVSQTQLANIISAEVEKEGRSFVLRAPASLPASPSLSSAPPS